MKPLVPINEFVEKYGFKKCKKPYDSCYYKCVARGGKMLFVSPLVFDIQDWKSDDPRIHKNPNCKYRDNYTAEDFLIEFVRLGMVGTDWD